jgi:hypothetical protein
MSEDDTIKGSHPLFCGTPFSIPAKSAAAFQINAANQNRRPGERGGRGREGGGEREIREREREEGE